MAVRLLFFAGALSSALVVSPLSAFTFNLTPASGWVGILNNPGFLQPGDEIVFGSGTYSTSSRLSLGFQGTAADPITIRAAEGANVILTRPNAAQNVLNIEGAQYLTFKGIEITGGSAGIRIGEKNGDQAKFITLDGNHIHDTGNAAVTANFNGQTYEGMHFLNNEIHDTGAEGEGFYLGCNNNACQFYDGIIEKNYIHDLNGPNITQGDGIEIKDGSYNNIIRDNVIHDTNFPGIIVYGVEEQGARNVIERNVIWNSGDHAIQVAADAIVRNNVIFSSTFDGIHSQNHQGAIPGNLTIVNNTIQTSNNAIDLGFPAGGVYSGPIEIANNALYPNGTFAFEASILAGVTLSGNVGTGFASGGQPTAAFDNSGNLATDFIDFLNKNPFPAIGSKLNGAGDVSFQPNDDFNTTLRGGTSDVGAYVFDASGNPGWDIVAGFKEFPAPGLAGDFDDDGDIDGADFLAWQRNPGVGDLGDWETNYGSSSSTLSVAARVPEPSSLILLAIGSLMTRWRR